MNGFVRLVSTVCFAGSLVAAAGCGGGASGGDSERVKDLAERWSESDNSIMDATAYLKDRIAGLSSVEDEKVDALIVDLCSSVVLAKTLGNDAVTEDSLILDLIGVNGMTESEARNFVQAGIAGGCPNGESRRVFPRANVELIERVNKTSDCSVLDEMRQVWTRDQPVDDSSKWVYQKTAQAIGDRQETVGCGPDWVKPTTTIDRCDALQDAWQESLGDQDDERSTSLEKALDECWAARGVG